MTVKMIDMSAVPLRTRRELIVFLEWCRATDKELAVRSMTVSGVELPPEDEARAIVCRRILALLEDPDRKCYTEDYWTEGGECCWLAKEPYGIASRADPSTVFFIGLRAETVTKSNGVVLNYLTCLWVPKHLVPTG